MLKAPIGVFDSGLGGITVLKHLLSVFPEESFIYLADTANLPYGDKKPEFIVRTVRSVLYFFVQQGVKGLIMACNTTSALALPVLSLESSIPLFGVVLPGIKKALQATKNGCIGVMANEATVNSGVFPSWITKISKELGRDVSVWQSACKRLVPLIEQGAEISLKTDAILKEYLSPLLSNGVDTIILGCTHYPIWQDRLERLTGTGVTFVDPAIPAVNEIKSWLEGEYSKISGVVPLKYANEEKRVSFWTTGSPEIFNARATVLLGDIVSAQQISLEIPESIIK